MIRDILEPMEANAGNANESLFTALDNIGGEGQTAGNGQDERIQFNRLEFESPADLMRHLYYTCLRSNVTEKPWELDDNEKFCPRRFDGWSCWEATPAGTVAENLCPKFVLGFDHRRLAYRT
ncbi:calcitonin receptor [Anopheles sinensis]|uniref:Calcitonin receptor n=1 Tax=Anopheles sinensis TaxID=74873 RepID=A0A084W0G8_ANOSI|nr:calcitonin receptor [Anopheles sinensis]